MGVGIRQFAAGRFGGRLAEEMRRLNGRHPWSHNDAFHPWIRSRLPQRREHALDVGCGRGDLLAGLAADFDHVTGIDTDLQMRSVAARRCAGLSNVSVRADSFDHIDGPFDVVTMIAVLHHLDVEAALRRVRELVRPGGKFLYVGLAPAVSPIDHLWDLASIATNPLIGIVRHPWVCTTPAAQAAFPTRVPELSVNEIREVSSRLLPGSVLTRHLGFRHTIEWTATP